MFPWRPDAKPVESLSTMRRFMPFISPRRNDSVFYMYQDIEVEAAIEYLEKKNASRPPDRQLTLFHLLVRACSQALRLRPGVNRFVKAGRLWQRDGEWITFSAKRGIEDGSPMFTVKRRFHADRESLDDMLDSYNAKIRPQRAGKQTQSDKEVNLMVKLPTVVIQLLMKLVGVLDYFSLLPRKMIDADPLYSSIFLANLGSINYPAGHHHLWEYGTCSLFGVMGRVEVGPNGRRTMRMAWTYDERIEDGLYSYYTLEGVRERFENPEQFEMTTDELAALPREGPPR